MIFYRKSPNQIAFKIDDETASTIAQWEKLTPYTSQELEVLQGAVDGSPSYHVIFFVDSNRQNRRWSTSVHLIIKKSLNHNFQAIYEGQESNDLVGLDATPCPQVIREPQSVILKIEGEVYQTLLNWKNWVEAEAFAGRYTYEFFENGTFDYKYIIVVDTFSGEEIVLEDSLSLWG
jgi:hypothetical protein